MTRRKVAPQASPEPEAPPPPRFPGWPSTPYIARNANRHVAIVLTRDAEANVARVITMGGDGLKLKRWAVRGRRHLGDEGKTLIITDPGLEDLWEPIEGYDTERGIKNFIDSATRLGAHLDVLEELSKLVEITEETKQLIRSKVKVVNIITREQRMKPNGHTEDEQQEQPAKEPRRTAASAFKELIMANELTDDEIFAQVKEEFQLEDKKRSYVGWYRNWLRKNGHNPPEALQTDEPAAPAPTPKPIATKAPPTSQPVAKPVAKPIAKPVAKPIAKPVAKGKR